MIVFQIFEEFSRIDPDPEDEIHIESTEEEENEHDAVEPIRNK